MGAREPVPVQWHSSCPSWWKKWPLGSIQPVQCVWWQLGQSPHAQGIAHGNNWMLWKIILFDIYSNNILKPSFLISFWPFALPSIHISHIKTALFVLARTATVCWCCSFIVSTHCSITSAAKKNWGDKRIGMKTELQRHERSGNRENWDYHRKTSPQAKRHKPSLL